MKKALFFKFKQSEDLSKNLLSTSPLTLVHNNPKDQYWGIGKGSGKNRLGVMLMEVR
jgi:predicted NAD-dependent protein-ADP-ribosyltransferase YbiA (DUF1768 family)